MTTDTFVSKAEAKAVGDKLATKYASKKWFLGVELLPVIILKPEDANIITVDFNLTTRDIETKASIWDVMVFVNRMPWFTQIPKIVNGKVIVMVEKIK